ncbi:Hpt domain-containing protein [Treponema sp.]|uniref:Hpt domain-containing protein n=1 Tax=Treponema sp. TaxID=166 RepID=UPI0025D8A7CC|nr:Hpt domain-containing protein [Treponema sp.]MCR5219179.1 Hpt domain-containing protein [Treponema sp.]
MMEILDIDAGLEYAGGEAEFFIELARAFIDDNPPSMEKLISLEKEDSLKAASYVHYYKGAARQLAAKKLSSIGQDLEDILRKKKEGSTEELNSLFINCHKETVEALKAAVKKLQ